MAKTKAPTGLTISRSDYTFTFKWKRGESNYRDGQKLLYRLQINGAWKAWKEVAVGKTTTTKAVALVKGDYYPSTGKQLDKIEFAVKGKNDSKSWSDYAKKIFTTNVPNKPTVTQQLSSEFSNETTFSWSVSTSNTDSKMYRDTQWQSVLVKDCNVPISDGKNIKFGTSALGWRTGTGSSVTITEETDLLQKGSHTRWIRVRSRGAKGFSEWVYQKHVYALPFQAKIIRTNAELTESGGFVCNVEWEATANETNPIDQTSVQYTIIQPNENLTCPSGASWTDANISKDTKGTDASVFSIDDTLDNDQCLFIRVNTKHDNNITYGNATLSAVGYLSDPSNVSVVTNNETFRATVTATNNSDIVDANLAVVFKSKNNPEKEYVAGIIEQGQSSVTIQCADWTKEGEIAFGVYAFVGEFEKVDRVDGADNYAVVERMRSKNTVIKGGAVPLPPSNVFVSQTTTQGTIQVIWDWSWADANIAILSWSDHEDAWESTDKPNEFEVSNLNASRWNISGLETGKKWYVRVCLANITNETETRSPWSEIVSIDLSSAPSIPTLVLSDGVISEKGSITCSWAYSTTDGTLQAYAEVCEVTIGESGITYGDIIAHTETQQHLTITAEEVGWSAGETHNLAVRVTSASGRVSDNWSNPVAVIIAEPLTINIASTSLEEVNVVDDTEQQIDRTVLSLIEMPLHIKVTGAGVGGTTIVAIERSQDYHVERPDESMFNGFEGETIALFSQDGEDEIVFTTDDLIVNFDDEAHYRIIATIKDSFGQTASKTLEFEVHWTHQATVPLGVVEIDEENLIAKIMPVAPTMIEEGDVCDIYRLSADKPQLIVENAVFGMTYVDPYPALKASGGHRLVFKTLNGDYITEDNQMAWRDFRESEGDILDIQQSIINFNGNTVLLNYNVNISNDWQKDFIATKYLGGSVQGDWNEGVTRTSNVSVTTITITEEETIRQLRELARYAGICHVRTSDGSSFSADIQVSETRVPEAYGMLVEFALSITKVDSETLDGMTLEQWESEE